jgi:hypothetical protein
MLPVHFVNSTADNVQSDKWPRLMTIAERYRHPKNLSGLIGRNACSLSRFPFAESVVSPRIFHCGTRKGARCNMFDSIGLFHHSKPRYGHDNRLAPVTGELRGELRKAGQRET